MCLHLALISVFATAGPFVSAQTPDVFGPSGGRRAVPSAKFLKQMNTSKDFKGIPDRKTLLVDALEYLSDLYDLTIIVDDRALKDAGVKDWEKMTLTKPMAAMRRATARQALDAVLSKLAAPQEAGILVFYRHDYVEITTVQALLKELPQQWRDLEYWASEVLWRTVGTYSALFDCPQEEVLDLALDLVPVNEIADLLAQAALIKYMIDCVLEGAKMNSLRSHGKGK